MPSKIQVDQIAGATGSTVTLPSGQTLDLSSGTVTLPSTALSALNATNLTSGTVPSARLSLTSSDLPTVPTTKGGTGLTTIGTASQVLRVNSGATGLEYGTVTSKIGQVLQTVKSSVFTTTNGVSGTGFTAVTGLSQAITPTATSSKILVMGSLSISAASGRVYSALFINGSISDFRGDSLGSASRTLNGHYLAGTAGTTRISFHYLHSPNSTSQQTYEWRVCNNMNDGSDTVYINRHNSTSGSNAADETSVSEITTIEVLA
jgi:hypothetical protein